MPQLNKLHLGPNAQQSIDPHVAAMHTLLERARESYIISTTGRWNANLQAFLWVWSRQSNKIEKKQLALAEKALELSKEPLFMAFFTKEGKVEKCLILNYIDQAIDHISHVPSPAQNNNGINFDRRFKTTQFLVPTPYLSSTPKDHQKNQKELDFKTKTVSFFMELHEIQNTEALKKLTKEKTDREDFLRSVNLGINYTQGLYLAFCKHYQDAYNKVVSSSEDSIKEWINSHGIKNDNKFNNLKLEEKKKLILGALGNGLNTLEEWAKTQDSIKKPIQASHEESVQHNFFKIAKRKFKKNLLEAPTIAIVLANIATGAQP